jgi:hypothetical protein
MSKRYVIQVLDIVTDENATDVAEVAPNADGEIVQAWFNVQHPQGGDWKTRRRSSAIADAAKLVHAGETRELRIAISRPVYALTPVAELDDAAIRQAATTVYNDHLHTDMTDEEADASYDGDDDEDEDDEDEDVDNDAEFELVEETNEGDGNSHNMN